MKHSPEFARPQFSKMKVERNNEKQQIFMKKRAGRQTQKGPPRPVSAEGSMTGA
jgi:hypothetical protein